MSLLCFKALPHVAMSCPLLPEGGGVVVVVVVVVVIVVVIAVRVVRVVVVVVVRSGGPRTYQSQFYPTESSYPVLISTSLLSGVF